MYLLTAAAIGVSGPDIGGVIRLYTMRIWITRACDEIVHIIDAHASLCTASSCSVEHITGRVKCITPSKWYSVAHIGYTISSKLFRLISPDMRIMASSDRYHIMDIPWERRGDDFIHHIWLRLCTDGKLFWDR